MASLSWVRTLVHVVAILCLFMALNVPIRFADCQDCQRRYIISHFITITRLTHLT